MTQPPQYVGYPRQAAKGSLSRSQRLKLLRDGFVIAFSTFALGAVFPVLPIQYWWSAEQLSRTAALIWRLAIDVANVGPWLALWILYAVAFSKILRGAGHKRWPALALASVLLVDALALWTLSRAGIALALFGGVFIAFSMMKSGLRGLGLNLRFGRTHDQMKRFIEEAQQADLQAASEPIRLDLTSDPAVQEVRLNA